MRADGLQRPIGYPSQTLCLGRPYDDGLDHFADVAKYNTSKSQPSEVGCRITCIRPLRVSREAANCQTERTNAQHATLQDEEEAQATSASASEGSTKKASSELQTEAATALAASAASSAPGKAPYLRNPGRRRPQRVARKRGRAKASPATRRRKTEAKGPRCLQKPEKLPKSPRQQHLAGSATKSNSKAAEGTTTKAMADSPEDRVIKVHSLHVRTEQVLALPSRRPPNWLHNGVESDRGDVVVDLVERPALSVASAFLGRLGPSVHLAMGAPLRNHLVQKALHAPVVRVKFANPGTVDHFVEQVSVRCDHLQPSIEASLSLARGHDCTVVPALEKLIQVAQNEEIDVDVYEPGELREVVRPHHRERVSRHLAGVVERIRHARELAELPTLAPEELLSLSDAVYVSIITRGHLQPAAMSECASVRAGKIHFRPDT
eukprot:CAMPEP_0204183578 /NCGR_PEP_ID=MMETSP0361-20130328/53721_1 /ASSEMBLY_ACC=CAM_ASM_000343 /TAXON_ID=268821 /ORGANISM="Scrippsiella Hangoei, Strain SHTV-5" /LENGTH=434 /DNA_ID=CAMNT_0051143479 /DNA_START=172 /DNA_END=1477 /DNA_ORIENTATION=-